MSFKTALNDAIRAGAHESEQPPFRTRVFAMGRPSVDLDRAVQPSADLEDLEIASKLQRGA